MSRKEYFAYGSNLNFEQMAYRCPEATVVGTAKLDGYELAFRRGYLTILPKEGASVEGLIWSVTDHDESQLDCYEGYPTFYDKETLTVTDTQNMPDKVAWKTLQSDLFANLPQIKAERMPQDFSVVLPKLWRKRQAWNAERTKRPPYRGEER